MRVAVITGAAQGIGAVIAVQAAREGYRVALWDVAADELPALAEEIGGGATWRAVDVTDEEQVVAAFDALPAPPALVVSNAGVVRFGPLLQLSLEDWRLALRVNLDSTFLVGRHAAARMAEAGGGSIVNIASINGVAAGLNAGAYTASKAGVIRLTEQMAMEWAELGVRVNVVAPGLILAGMSDAIYADEDVRALRQAQVPLQRLGQAEDVAGCVLFLASDAASYVTGQLLTVDGGLTKGALRNLARPRDIDQVGLGD